MRFFTIAILSCLLTDICSAASPNYFSEADTFLHSLPKNMQSDQSHAIHAARAGDASALNSVRNARNTIVAPPEDVVCKDFPNMRLYQPQQHNSLPMPLLIYFHGGGWTFGSINSCARFCGKLAQCGKVSVLAVNYRLAPENPWPAGLQDCIASVKYAASHVEEWECSTISLGGDSSGGNLAFVSALCLQDAIRIKSLVLFYPVVKAWNDKSDSWRQFGNGFGLDVSLMDEFNLAYRGSESAQNPEISPACQSDEKLKRLPPILFVAADRDILRDQGKSFAEKLNRLGVAVRYRLLKGSVHLFVTVQGQESAFQTAVEETNTFLLSTPQQ